MLTPFLFNDFGVAVITAAFLFAGLLAYVIIPGMFVIRDRVLAHMEW